MANNAADSEQLSRPRTFRLVWYNLGLMLIMSLLLYRVIMQAAEADAAAQAAAAKTAAKTETTSPKKTSAAPVPSDTAAASAAAGDTSASNASGSDTVSPAEPTKQEEKKQPANPMMIAYVLWAISLAGGLGGVLCNLRGVFEFERDKSYFPAYLELPFYLRPVSGVLCGLFTFFVSTFFAGALTQGDGDGWQTLPGMFPYIGIAFIAGFASQEFMERLKETAKTLFGVPSAAEPPEAPPPPPPPPPAGDAGDEGHESFRGAVADDAGLESTKKRAATPAPVPLPVPPPPTPRRKAD